VASVMDGDIDGLIQAYLKQRATKGNAPLSAVSDEDDL